MMTEQGRRKMRSGMTKIRALAREASNICKLFSARLVILESEHVSIFVGLGLGHPKIESLFQSAYSCNTIAAPCTYTHYLRESEGICFYRRWFVCLSVCLSLCL